ncbi:MAG: UDP-N-acetylmuramate dehydrogenase [Firmicutes bacterium]|jgi:UDP-N-acetylmuramate dehydrogenase|nr:UDP-N-acetylmuramate dehydrogenase [Bacillota bacterium]
MEKKYLDFIAKTKPILVERDVLLSGYTTFKIGGPADLLAKPKNIEELKVLLSTAKDLEIPYFIMGCGSNLLIKDSGLRGLVILLADNFSEIIQEGSNTLNALAGARLIALARFALALGLGGFEFASGIPGSLGGAIVMNAGAYGGEMVQVVKSVWLLKEDGSVVEHSNEEMEFGYRKSRLNKEKSIVLAATIELASKNRDEIKALMDDLSQRRRDKQPVTEPSAGSFFKRPPGHYAAALIDQAGLKGYKIGGAYVSPLHAGFVLSDGTATAADVIALKEHIQKTVYDKFQVELEPEVKIIGDE